MATLYVYENFHDQPERTVAQITRATEGECVAVFNDHFGDDYSYSWSSLGMPDSADAVEL